MNAQLSFLTAGGDIDGAALRDAGIAQVAESNKQWLDNTMPVLRRYCEQHEEVTCELFRMWNERAGGQQPLDHHAWGALFRRASKAGLIVFRAFMAAQSAKTRAHPIRVYSSTVYRRPS